jgi:hydrogenase nickel incorporation protein HypA/HybF
MHEIGIANSVLNASVAECAKRPGVKLTRIGVRIGVLAGVDIGALRFAFEALTKETELEQVEIEIQSCPRRNRCLDCDAEFVSELYTEPCPKCASERVILIGGEELDMAFIEVDEL